jgi:hypothetical protein
VPVVGLKTLAFLAGFPLALVRCVTEWGEQRFPFFLGSFRKSVSVRRGGH